MDVEVFKLKIKDVLQVDGQTVLVFEPGQPVSDNLVVTDEFYSANKPAPGGYYIMCEGGIGKYSAM